MKIPGSGFCHPARTKGRSGRRIVIVPTARSSVEVKVNIADNRSPYTERLDPFERFRHVLEHRMSDRLSVEAVQSLGNLRLQRTPEGCIVCTSGRPYGIIAELEHVGHHRSRGRDIRLCVRDLQGSRC